MTKKILIVEDENIVAIGIKKMLKKMGYLVPCIAATGQEALDKIEKTFPDLVLMDITLKGDINGIQTVEQILKKQKLPIIYITAYSDLYNMNDKVMSQASGFIKKPFNEKDLEETINNIFKKKT